MSDPTPSNPMKVRVLVVDDAVVIRKLLTDALATDPEVEVVGTAGNGRIALSKIELLRPDLVTLDVEMPEMDGLATLRAIRRRLPRLPVVMFSTVTAQGASATLEALAAGASDYVAKPANVGSVTAAIAAIRGELLPRIKALCGRAAVPAPPSPVATVSRPAVIAVRRVPIEAVVVGISTGGPNALAEVLPALPPDLPVPVLIVQHMPPVFTRLLAERLGARCALPVVEAVAGEAIAAGKVYLAPGDFHMTISPRWQVALGQGPPENSCRPAVDVLFRSAAAICGPGALGVVLTGMGSDGLHGCQAIRAAGGTVLAQDEATSTVWGMPGFVARAGLADQIVPLGEVAHTIVRRVNDNRVPRRLSA
jgi:two-component system chemotaxis response regulator CheB